MEKHGGRAQGVKNYSIINHTPAGYPNQCQHYNYPLMTSGEGLAEFAKKYCWLFPLVGSASEDYDAFSVTPYDVGWGYLVNFDHDFVGKDALLAIKANPPKKEVTLEWNTEDVGDVFMSQFRGKDVEPYDDISYTSQIADPAGAGTIRADWVECDGQKIGIASGRCNAFYERRMISLGFIAKEYAVEGRELLIRWGQPNGIQKMIRATVARFPYYNEEMRNETFDVEKIPHPQFD